MRYARIKDQDSHSAGVTLKPGNMVVLEVIDDHGNDINTMFHKDIIAQLVPDPKGQAVVNGKWDGKDFHPVPIVLPTWSDIRLMRDERLKETDHWAFVDATQIMSDAMKEYRQSLRDLPQTYENPEDVVLPIKPNEK
jgi:hypothetical protein